MKIRSKILFLICIGILICCNRNKNEEPQPIQYYPEMKIGDAWIYRIDEVSKILSKEIGSTYILKIEVIDTLRYNGEKYFQKAWYKSSSEVGSWEYLKTSFEYRNQKGVFEKELNNHFQKVAFPVAFSTSWKVDQRTGVFEEGKAKYLTFNKKFTFGQEVLNDIYGVAVKYDSTGIYNFQEFEEYSPKYGLVSAYKKNILYCQENAACLGKNIEESKTTITQTLVKVIR
ncbi:hypothetical protein [Lacihabitans soyangensis]|uniref:Uncharacterized protein n=1 Tax=Lacihabitans soyangensis TaxID=869394 RepID=A0AAE3KUM0_9BACT|nr:hypothetical protein [Lacihabitans soyangensis]MCP9765697.1 hypothetical protein [Lacihabitans soyangensis]